MLEIFLSFSAVAGFVCPFQSLLGYSNLVSGLFDHNTLVWRRFLKYIHPLFSPLSRVFPKFLEGLIRDCKKSPGNSASFLLFTLSHNGEGFYVLFPFSPTGLFLPPFIMFCDEERIK